MRIEVDGQHFEVPDDATPDEIDALTKPAAPPRQVGKAEALLRGAAQGATLGFGDEMEAGWKHLVGGADYKSTRDQLRADEANARTQHPTAYLGGEMAGGAAPGIAATVLTGGAAAGPALAAGQGAAQGAGYSNASDARGLSRDSAVGGGVGLLGYGASKAMGSAASRLAGWARAGSTRATANAAQKTADKVAEQIASARGALGGEVQKGNRLVENLRRLGTPLGPTEQAAADDLEQRLAASNLQSLPDQAGIIATKDAELQALKSGASDALKSGTAELLSTAEAKRQLSSRALRYGPVAAGTILGTAIGGPVGSAVGALVGAGSRPMIRSVIRLGQTPAVQKAGFDAIAGAAESTPGDILRQLLTRGGATAATQSLVTP